MKIITPLLALILVGLASSSQASTCYQLFGGKSSPNSLKIMKDPDSSPLLKRILAAGKILKIKSPLPIFYTPDSMVPKVLYLRFLTESVDKLDSKLRLLESESNNPQSAYQIRKEVLNTQLIPEVKELREQINDIVQSKSSEVQLKDLYRLTDRLANALSFRSSAEYMFLLKELIETHPRFFDQGLAQSFLKDPHNPALFQKLLESDPGLAGRLGHQGRTIRLLLLMGTGKSNLSLVSVSRGIKDFRQGYLLPFYSWHPAAEVTQLFAKSQRLHIITISDSTRNFHEEKNGPPAEYASHDYAHKVVSLLPFTKPSKGISPKEPLSPEQALVWFNEFEGFLNFLISGLQRFKLTEWQTYSAIHTFAVASHEHGYGPSFFNGTPGEIKSKPLIESSKDYGEQNFINGKNQLAIQTGLNILPTFYSNYKKSTQGHR